jgi:hypothetical protein
MTHEIAIGLIERWLGGTASPDDWDALAGHLRECGDCRRRYQKLRTDLLEAEGRPASEHHLTKHEIDLAASLTLARIASQEQSDSAPVHASQAESKRQAPSRTRFVDSRRRMAQTGLAVGAAALFVAVLYRAGVDQPGAGTGFRSLGTDTTAVGLQVICFQRDNPERHTFLKESGRCAAQSYVKLQVSSLDPTMREVSAVAMSDDLRPLRVFRATLADSRPLTLDGYLDLGEHRRVGVAFVFSSKPVSETALRAGVDLAKKRGQTLSGLETLPIDERATQKLLVIEAEDDR